MPRQRTMLTCEQCSGLFPRTRGKRPVRYCSRRCFTDSFELIARFESKVSKPDDPDACHRWLGGLYRSGYGVFTANDKPLRAHMVAYRLYVGEIPDGLLICHTCPGGGNRWCVNPRHLIAAPHLTNVQHAIDAGRTLTGTRNPKAKLNDANIREIRRRASNGEPLAQLAREFLVANWTISAIVRRKTWKHVE